MSVVDQQRARSSPFAAAIALANRDARPALLALAVLQILVLLGFLAFHQNPPLFDEPWYLETVNLLHDKGFGREFLLTLPGPAGPLYTVVQYAFEPITRLKAPAVRFVNPLLLFVSMGLTYAALRAFESRDRMGIALASIAILGVPMTWVIAGMALTEMPALLFAAAAMTATVWAFDPRTSGARRMILAALAGLCFAIAVLGRQPYLVLIGGLPFLIKDIRRDTPPMIVLGLAMVAVCAPVFWIWKGMVPPRTAWTGAGIVPEHGVRSMCYAAAIVFFLAPRFLRLNKLTLTVVVIVAIVLQVVLGKPGAVPMRSMVERVLPAAMVSRVAMVIPALTLALGIMFVVATALRALENRTDRRYLALLAATMLLLLTPLKITHLFSSRYAAMTLPLIVAVTYRYTSHNYWKVVRLALGGALGLASLYSYFHRSPFQTLG